MHTSANPNEKDMKIELGVFEIYVKLLQNFKVVTHNGFLIIIFYT